MKSQINRILIINIANIYCNWGFSGILGDLNHKNDLNAVKKARRLYRTCLNTGKKKKK